MPASDPFQTQGMSAAGFPASAVSGALARPFCIGAKRLTLTWDGRVLPLVLSWTVSSFPITRVRAAGPMGRKLTAQQPGLPTLRRYSTILCLRRSHATISPAAGLVPLVPVAMRENYLSSDAYRRAWSSLLTPLKLATRMKVRSKLDCLRFINLLSVSRHSAWRWLWTERSLMALLKTMRETRSAEDSAAAVRLAAVLCRGKVELSSYACDDEQEATTTVQRRFWTPAEASGSRRA